MSEIVLTWPERPTCHDSDWQARRLAGIEGARRWREPRGHRDGGPYAETFRTCFYCGSIHPEDLYRLLSSGTATLGGSDWKYGWPHKFYVEGIPNPVAGQRVQTGAQFEGGIRTPIYGAAPATVHAKWYNEHLTDDGYSLEALDALTTLIEGHSGIQFYSADGRLMYRAPHAGYQRGAGL
jgi:hypothetical protein